MSYRFKYDLRKNNIFMKRANKVDFDFLKPTELSLASITILNTV